MTPEIALLLACSRSARCAAPDSLIQDIIDRGIDWQLFARLCKHHRLWPQIHPSLTNPALTGVPPSFGEWLDVFCKRNTFQKLALTHTLASLLKLFAEHDIPAVPFKGPVLAAYAYHNLALRHAGDLDIVIAREHVERAVSLLLENGYEHDLLPGQLDAYFEDFFEYRLVKGNEVVEIHWGFAERWEAFPVTLADLSPRLGTVDLGGGNTVPTFSPEDTLLLLCVHGGMRHYFEKLVWICDVARVMEVLSDSDWERAFERADELGLKRVLALALLLAHDLFGVELPARGEQWIHSDRVVYYLANRLLKRAFGSMDKPGRPTRVYYYMLMREGYRARWTCVRELSLNLLRGKLKKP
jgi:hypothetical protein